MRGTFHLGTLTVPTFDSSEVVPVCESGLKPWMSELHQSQILLDVRVSCFAMAHAVQLVVASQKLVSLLTPEACHCKSHFVAHFVACFTSMPHFISLHAKHASRWSSDTQIHNIEERWLQNDGSGCSCMQKANQEAAMTCDDSWMGTCCNGGRKVQHV